MKATLYNFGTNNHGFYVQRETPNKVIENITKQELIQLANLRHSFLSKAEFYTVLSTDYKCRPLKEFELLASTFLIVVNR